MRRTGMTGRMWSLKGCLVMCEKRRCNSLHSRLPTVPPSAEEAYLKKEIAKNERFNKHATNERWKVNDRDITPTTLMLVYNYFFHDGESVDEIGEMLKRSSGVILSIVQYWRRKDARQRIKPGTRFIDEDERRYGYGGGYGRNFMADVSGGNFRKIIGIPQRLYGRKPNL